MIERNPKRRDILILDDDADLDVELIQMLRANGLLANAETDATQIRPDDFDNVDVLVLDLKLPNVDGTDILALLPDCSRPPALILTTGQGEGMLRAASMAAERAGLTVLGALPKPFDPDALLALLNAENRAPLARPENALSDDDIRAALVTALDRRSLPVAFQPLVDAAALRFEGAEALLAGHLDPFGPIGPDRIVAVAAGDVALLVRLTHDVLRQAASACAAWTAAGFSGDVSVNLPLDVLLQPAEVDRFAAIVDAAGIARGRVIFELTEDALYDTSAAALGALIKLRLAGFALALDDVGQRQSGLLQLANLPVTEMKIDLELVRAARTWEKARNIFSSLGDLGHRLGLTIVAEGVETKEDLALARRNKVHYVQGYLISRKKPLRELIAMLPVLASNLTDGSKSQRETGREA
ncbi:EAL domain-containing protein [Amorphus sp. 3PC139-8]|uniref:EAL domain-containing response regulator n=1 Tax=Amorphus sp. 3PC139-8 TaxID=2735676 RepID=UPI00345DF956